MTGLFTSARLSTTEVVCIHWQACQCTLCFCICVVGRSLSRSDLYHISILITWKTQTHEIFKTIPQNCIWIIWIIHTKIHFWRYLKMFPKIYIPYLTFVSRIIYPTQPGEWGSLDWRGYINTSKKVNSINLYNLLFHTEPILWKAFWSIKKMWCIGAYTLY